MNINFVRKPFVNHYSINLYRRRGKSVFVSKLFVVLSVFNQLKNYEKNCSKWFVFVFLLRIQNFTMKIDEKKQTTVFIVRFSLSIVSVFSAVILVHFAFRVPLNSIPLFYDCFCSRVVFATLNSKITTIYFNTVLMKLIIFFVFTERLVCTSLAMSACYKTEKMSKWKIKFRLSIHPLHTPIA